MVEKRHCGETPLSEDIVADIHTPFIQEKLRSLEFVRSIFIEDLMKTWIYKVGVNLMNSNQVRCSVYLLGLK